MVVKKLLTFFKLDIIISFMDPIEEETLTMDDFVIFSSPRYFRLVFNELKPDTKNGDLVSALGELKQRHFLTSDSYWEKIKLTKKGNQYKRIIKRLIDLDALHVPQTNGLFDYRTEPGRKAICELIRFFSAKLNFTDYFQYLKLPLFRKRCCRYELGRTFWHYFSTRRGL